MIGWFIAGIVIILYGIMCIVLGIFKFPQPLWNMGKIQGFVKIMGVIGTQIFLAIFGAAAMAGGIVLMLYNLPK